MPRAYVPEGYAPGVIDLRDYGEGQVPVETDESGRYVDVDSDQAAQAVRASYPDAQPDTSDSEPAASDEEPNTCSVVMSNDEVCGRELPCQYHDMEGA